MDQDVDITFVKSAIQRPLSPCRNEDDPREWARFGLRIFFQLQQQIREMRLKVSDLTQGQKGDGSPFTVFEHQLEEQVQRQLNLFFPKAGFWGEEKGDRSQDQEIRLIIDPIDGTRSFLSGFDSFAIAMSVVRKKDPVFSAIGAPATGDIGFRAGDGTSKLIQLPLQRAALQMADLPVFAPGKQDPVLVNVHPSPKAQSFLNRFYKLWEQRKIALVRSTSGSPSLAILEVAKGTSTYFNLWDANPTKPYDLVPAHHLLTGSRGEMLDVNANPVDPWHHSGPFLCGCNSAHLQLIINEL